MMYVQDYDEIFPFVGCYGCGGTGADANSPTCLTHGKIYPYVKNANVFDCPSTDMGVVQLDAGLNIGRVSGTWPVPREFYGTSCDIGWNDQMGSIRLATLQAPAQTVMWSDANFALSCGGTRTVYANACAAACTRTLRLDSNTRHNGGENLVFADGHAKWMPATAIAGECGKLFQPDPANWNITYYSKWGN